MKFNLLFITLFCLLATFLYVGVFHTDWDSVSAPGGAGGLHWGKGGEAVDFALLDLNGRRVSLSDFRGKVVFLNFWATWCGPCQIEIPSLARLRDHYRGRNFQLLTISIDQEGRRAVEAFFRQHNVSLPTLIDAEARVASQFGVQGVPSSFLIDGRGVVERTFLGPQEWMAPEILRIIDRLLIAPAG